MLMHVLRGDPLSFPEPKPAGLRAILSLVIYFGTVMFAGRLALFGLILLLSG